MHTTPASDIINLTLSLSNLGLKNLKNRGRSSLATPHVTRELIF